MLLAGSIEDPHDVHEVGGPEMKYGQGSKEGSPENLAGIGLEEVGVGRTSGDKFASDKQIQIRRIKKRPWHG